MTRSRTASIAHLPRAMLTSAIGASTRAVAALQRSTEALDAATALGPGAEGLEGAQELLGGEVGPQRVRDVELRVGDLPEQEVRDAELAAGTDHQVDLGYVGGVEVACEGHLVDVFRRETVGHYPTGGVHDLRAPTVVERDINVQAVVHRGEILGLLHGFEHRGRQMLPSSQETEPGPTLVQLGHLLAGRLEEELHERLYLPLRTRPVLGREGIEGQRLDPGVARRLEQRRKHRDAGPVAGGARKPASPGPAPVAVHDDGDVTRNPLWVGDALLGGVCGVAFLDGFQQLDLRELGFLVGKGSLDPLDVAVGELLQLILGPVLLVLGDLAFLAQLVQVLHLVAAHVPDGDPSLLGHAPRHPYEVPAALLCEFRYREPQYLAVVLGVEADIGVPYGALDVLEGVRVEGGDGEEPRLRGTDVRDAPKGHPRPVDLDLDPVQERGVRPARAYRREIAPHRLDGPLHPAFGRREIYNVRHLSLLPRSRRPTPATPPVLPARYGAGYPL